MSMASTSSWSARINGVGSRACSPGPCRPRSSSGPTFLCSSPSRDDQQSGVVFVYLLLAASVASAALFWGQWGWMAASVRDRCRRSTPRCGARSGSRPGCGGAFALGAAAVANGPPRACTSSPPSRALPSSPWQSLAPADHPRHNGPSRGGTLPNTNRCHSVKPLLLGPRGWPDPGAARCAGQAFPSAPEGRS